MSPTSSTPIKPGVQTSEFWKSLAVIVVTALAGLGVIGPDSNLVDAISLAGTSLTAAAYAISRALVKKS